MRVVPCLNRVLVKKLPEETKTAGGIHIPPMAQKRCTLCEVVEVGPGTRDSTGKAMPIDLKPGEKVFVSRFVMEDVEVDGTEYHLVLEHDVLGVLRD